MRENSKAADRRYSTVQCTVSECDFTMIFSEKKNSGAYFNYSQLICLFSTHLVYVLCTVHCAAFVHASLNTWILKILPTDRGKAVLEFVYKLKRFFIMQPEVGGRREGRGEEREEEGGWGVGVERGGGWGGGE